MSSRSWTRGTGLGIILAATWLHCAEACDSGSAPSAMGGHGGVGGGLAHDAGDGGSQADAPDALGPDAGAGGHGGGGASECPGYDKPAGIPDGWVPYGGDWSCDCQFYYAPEPSLPPPIEWEPCPHNPDPSLVCESMVVSWSDDPLYGIGLNNYFARDSDGKVLLGFRRVSPRPDGTKILFDIVAEADGEVRWAFAQVSDTPSGIDPGCRLGIKALSSTHAVFVTEGTHHFKESSDTELRGSLAGPIGERPVVTNAYGEPYYGFGWYASQDHHAAQTPGAFLLEARLPGWELRAFAWGKYDAPMLVHSAAIDPQGIPWTNLSPWGDAVFFVTLGATSQGVNLWTQGGGLVPFRRWVDDPSRGASSFGTDGVDMVWVEGEGKAPGSSTYASKNVVRAPFTTDPSAVVPVPVRPFLGDLDHKPMFVGCGYAAREQNYVVRLADGVRWVVPQVHEPPLFWPAMPLGVTCDDVYMLASLGQRLNLVRIRLDSLGPGDPP